MTQQAFKVPAKADPQQSLAEMKQFVKNHLDGFVIQNGRTSKD